MSQLKFKSVAAATSGSGNVLVAAVTAPYPRRIRVVNYVLIAAGAVNAKFQSNQATDLTGPMNLPANGGVSAPHAPWTPGAGLLGHFETAPGEALTLNLSGAVEVDGHLSYVEVA